MIPTWHKPIEGEQKTTKNPFKLMAMVDGMGWLLFFSGRFSFSDSLLSGHSSE